MKKTVRIVVKCTPQQLRAVHRFAKAQRMTASALVNARVIAPAVEFDPRQKTLPLHETSPTPPK